MQAMVIEEFGDTKQLHLKELSKPLPEANEVQIQVCNAGVNPIDWKICQGHFKKMMPCVFPLVPGWDVSGVVTAVGKNVKKFKVGDQVFAYCRKPVVQWGCYAEYVTFDADNVALKPKHISFSQAASIPLAALTAWQALFDVAKLKRGETILVHAGAGGVGGFAIEFAKYAGAKITTTASETNHPYVKKLGAEHAIDYRKTSFIQEMRKLYPQGVDIVFDTVGGPTLQESLEVLKPQGRLISIVEHLDPTLVQQKNVQFSFVLVSPNGEQLKKIATLIEDGKVAVPEITEFQLSEAPRALDISKQGHTKGKIVLRVK